MISTSSSTDTLTINGTSGNDAIGIANGSSTLNAFGINFTGVGLVTINPQAGTDTLTVEGTTSNNNISVNTSQINLNGLPVNYSNAEKLVVDTGSGNDILTQLGNPGAPLTLAVLGTGTDTFDLNGGSIAFAADQGLLTASLTINIATGANATFNSTQHLAA